MLSHEVDRTTVEITVATNGIIESKKRLENPVYPQSIKNLLNILANRPGAIEIFRALQKEK